MPPSSGTVLGTTQIVDHGSPADRFNIVLVSDGYRATEMAQFASDAQALVDQLFATAPFDEMQCALNVYRIDVTSTDSGADDPAPCGGSGASADTYFDASFCNNGIQRLMSVNEATVLSVVNAEVPEWHQILVIVNTPILGGAGGSIAISSNAGDGENVGIHEFGHSGFGLADEYEYYVGCGSETDRDTYVGGEPSEPNVTTNTDRATIKWGDLILATTPLPTTSNPDCTQCDTQPNPLVAGTVGAYEGARYYHCGAYRPEYDCMMRNLTGFCAVCRRRIRQTLRPYLADCYAPVFAASGGFACFVIALVSILVIALLLILAWLPPILCLIKQLIFRIQHCTEGNSDRCIEL